MIQNQLINYTRRQLMSKKKTSLHEKQNMKQWKSNEGYTFWARDEEDAKLYLKHTGQHLGSLKEVVKEK